MTRTFVVIQSPAGSEKAMEGKRLARSFGADLVLMGEGAGLAREESLGGFCGTVFVSRDDLDDQGIADLELDRVVKVTTKDELARLLVEGDVLDTF